MINFSICRTDRLLADNDNNIFLSFEYVTSKANLADPILCSELGLSDLQSHFNIMLLKELNSFITHV
jgi:hypothetical protein